MKSRTALAIVSLLLSLAISADHKSNECTGCWITSSAAPTLDLALGVNVHFTDPKPGEVKMIADAGFHWVRMDFVWALTERERGKYDFSAYDQLLRELDTYNIRALLILDYGNPLYTEGKSVRTPAAREAFARWAVAAAKHFAGRGVVWEVFNEPNVPLFWPPQPDVEEYKTLAADVGRVFHASLPNEQLIGPATSKIDFPFLDACFKSKLLDDWSAVSVHPYRQTNPETVASEYARLREMLNRYGTKKNISIASSEWGYSSAWSHMNDETQALMLAREFLTNVANGIQISIWYDWRDDGNDPNEPEDHFGLVRNTYRPGQNPAYDPKPAYLAAKTLSKALAGYSFQERLNIGSADDYILVFAKDSDRRFVAWTSLPMKRQVIMHNLAGQYSVISAKGESVGSITPTNGSLTLELTSTPKYLIPLY